MRIRVTDILAMLAEDATQEEILKDFPYLEPDDIKAALALRSAPSRSRGPATGVNLLHGISGRR
jgi:uncharacterized protein (DUF433 family)